jgi:hypothetical protein
MNGKANGPPKGEAWVWLTRELLASDAWRAMSGKARKAVDFLLLEHMSHGGRANGKLKAPHRQLRKFGIGTAFTGPAMLECEQLGLIDSHRGGGRVATVYTLTWLPLHDGTQASNRWREYVAEKQKSVPRTGDSTTSQTRYRPLKTVPHTRYRTVAKPTSERGYAYKKSSYQGGDNTTDLSVDKWHDGSAPAGLAALLDEASDWGGLQ